MRLQISLRRSGNGIRLQRRMGIVVFTYARSGQQKRSGIFERFAMEYDGSRERFLPNVAKYGEGGRQERMRVARFRVLFGSRRFGFQLERDLERNSATCLSGDRHGDVDLHGDRRGSLHVLVVLPKHRPLCWKHLAFALRRLAPFVLDVVRSPAVAYFEPAGYPTIAYAYVEDRDEAGGARSCENENGAREAIVCRRKDFEIEPPPLSARIETTQRKFMRQGDDERKRRVVADAVGRLVFPREADVRDVVFLIDS